MKKGLSVLKLKKTPMKSLYIICTNFLLKLRFLAFFLYAASNALDVSQLQRSAYCV